MWWTRWGRAPEAPGRRPGRAADARAPPGRCAAAAPGREADRFAADAEGRVPARDAEALLPGRVAPLRAPADALRLDDGVERAARLGTDRVDARDDDGEEDEPRVPGGPTASGRLALAARETATPREDAPGRRAAAPWEETVRRCAAGTEAERDAPGAVRATGACREAGADRTAGADRAAELRATGARLGADRAAGAPRRTGRLSAWVSAAAASAAASAMPLLSITPTGASRSAARAVPDSPQSTRLSQGRMRVVRDLSVMVSSSQVALGSPGGTEAGGVHSQTGGPNVGRGGLRVVRDPGLAG